MKWNDISWNISFHFISVKVLSWKIHEIISGRFHFISFQSVQLSETEMHLKIFQHHFISFHFNHWVQKLSQIWLLGQLGLGWGFCFSRWARNGAMLQGTECWWRRTRHVFEHELPHASWRKLDIERATLPSRPCGISFHEKLHFISFQSNFWVEKYMKSFQVRFISFHFNQVQSVQLKNCWNDFSCFSFHFISIRFWKKAENELINFQVLFHFISFQSGTPHCPP